MKSCLYLALAFSLAMMGCAGQRTINPDWKTAPEQFTVLVSEPYVTNEDDVTDDFQTMENFRTWAVNYLDTALSSYTDVRHSVTQVSDENFEIVEKSIDDESVKIPMPAVEKMDGLNGVALSVHPLRFWRDASLCPNGGCFGGKHLNLAVAYSIVRVENNELLAYGVAFAEDSFTFAMTKGNWESVIERIAKKVVKETPLEK